MVNLSTKHIQNIESNKYLLSLDKLVEICKVLNVTPNYLPVSYTHLDVYKRQIYELMGDSLHIAEQIFMFYFISQ